ncbi:MAG: class I SAM-dependent methyltransferase [Candidatus Latescibacteria bacterium]|jgi:ubiquinone/menaquinone biosynthesis C-methylase UbiE|nr:class I SAM-dependent methyltransferase [Candidatus Latescibacterota bacterium]
MATDKPTSREVDPYSKLASIYDHVMRHVDYVHWTDYVESLAVRHGAKPLRVLDLACGTGTLALELGRRGYDVSGADGSAAMLEVAQEKAAAAGVDIAYHHRDLLWLRDLPQFEWVLCLYDSVNYLMSLDDVSRALVEMQSVVEPGGLLVFDVCTESNSLRYFRDMTDRDQGKGFSYVRRSTYHEGIQYNRFDIQFEVPREDVCEVHKQRIYPLSEIEIALASCPFTVEGRYDGFGFNAPGERSDRVHFVLRR